MPPLSLHADRPPPALHSFPTRRSSDLHHSRFQKNAGADDVSNVDGDCRDQSETADQLGVFSLHSLDRKSTRLNSSHLVISYAVFCLKKKKKKQTAVKRRR